MNHDWQADKDDFLECEYSKEIFKRIQRLDSEFSEKGEKALFCVRAFKDSRPPEEIHLRIVHELEDEFYDKQRDADYAGWYYYPAERWLSWQD